MRRVAANTWVSDLSVREWASMELHELYASRVKEILEAAKNSAHLGMSEDMRKSVREILRLRAAREHRERLRKRRGE